MYMYDHIHIIIHIHIFIIFKSFNGEYNRGIISMQQNNSKEYIIN